MAGEVAFELYDTYGFPLEMTREIASDAGVRVDERGFAEAMDQQRARSRSSDRGGDPAHEDVGPVAKEPTRFLGYATTKAESTVDDVLEADGRNRRLVFRESPFYAEAGGQVSDVGRIENNTRPGTACVVRATRNPNGVVLHHVEDVDGQFLAGDTCALIVDAPRRRRIERNHTATHLLHAALREVLGPHVKQAGSEVNDRELRFDFSHVDKMTAAEIARAEDVANAAALADHPVTIEELSLEDAKASGAIGLFEDEYRGRDTVRVVCVDDVSRELCGGTHVRRSGEIGLIRIVSEESIASGIRRIRAITGDAVLARLREQAAFLERMKVALSDDPEETLSRLKEENAALRAQLADVHESRASATGEQLLGASTEVAGVRVISGRVDMPADQIKALGDLLEQRGRPSVVILVGDAGGRGIAVCKTSKNVANVDAGAVVREMASVLGGGGGGGRSFAQGGGPNVDRLDEALASGAKAVRSALS